MVEPSACFPGLQGIVDDPGPKRHEPGLLSFVDEVQLHAATTGVQLIFPTDEADLADRNVKVVSGEFGPFDSRWA